MSVFEEIQRILKRSARDKDNQIFRSYNLGEITIEDCLEKFFANNYATDEQRKEVTTDMFKEWLRTEGWWDHAL